MKAQLLFEYQPLKLRQFTWFFSSFTLTSGPRIFGQH